MLLGIDLGTSSVKVSLVEVSSRRTLASATFPEREAPIISLQPGWAEQNPNEWWTYTLAALQLLKKQHEFSAVKAVGIAYQMHGLVLVDRERNALRNSIIWCDSRAVPYGDKAFQQIGAAKCLDTVLNSPGNFTAAKLAWVKDNEPEIFQRIYKVMLPGDFIAMKLTGEITSSSSGLSEAILWDFSNESIAAEVLDYFGFSHAMFPPVRSVFDVHGTMSAETSGLTGLPVGTPVSYKAGDQPNNALSLNVLQPGDVAVNAGTSGVIYAVADQPVADPLSRVNSFAHVNHSAEDTRIGVLLCINGAGITNKWVRSITGTTMSYDTLNQEAAGIPSGADGLMMFPFGNGAERMLQNRIVGASMLHLDYNKHTHAHVYRAGLEGVAFAFRYGLEILKENGIVPTVVRAGHANMFLSDVFTGCFVNTTGLPLELYDNDGSTGAAIGAGIGAGMFNSEDAFYAHRPLRSIIPDKTTVYDALYERWKTQLNKLL